MVELVLNSHIFPHIHCIPTKPDPSPQPEMRARVGNLLQGRSITSSSVAFNGVAEKVHLTLFEDMKQRCRKKPFCSLVSLVVEVFDKPVESFERPTYIHENELWDIGDVRKIHLASDDNGFG